MCKHNGGKKQTHQSSYGMYKTFDCTQLCTQRVCLVFFVKIRHSSLMLKEALLILTNKPQDGGEESTNRVTEKAVYTRHPANHPQFVQNVS
jgi:hypothetical protein